MRNVRTDTRTGNLYSRPSFKLANGTTVRKYVTPGEFGLPNTPRGLELAVQRMAARLYAEATSSTPINPSPNPSPPAAVAPATPPKEVPTFAAFAAESWLPRYAHKNKPATVKQKGKLVRLLSKHFGPRRLDEIDTRACDEWIRTLQGRYAHTSQGVAACTLRSVLLLAREYRLIAEVPKLSVAAPRNQSTLFWTPVELDRVVASSRSPFRAMIDVASRTGMRIGELRALRWVNVDFEKRQIRICENLVLGKVGTPKGNRARVLPMSDETYAILQDLHALADPGCPWVFAQSGARLGRNALYAELRRAATAAGVAMPRGKAWHVLRHSYGTIMSGGAGNLDAATPMPLVRDLMGHADLRETQRYTHSDSAALASAASRIDAGRSTRTPTAPRTIPPTAAAMPIAA